HEATLKLNAAEQNLSRVDDVAGEVERQVEVLKRQARQAKRYKNVSAEIRTLEATVHHLRWVEARTAVRDTEAALTAARSAMAEAAALQTRTATDHAAAQHDMPALREAEAAALAARQRLTTALAALDEKDRQTAARLKALSDACEGLAKDLARQDGAEADATQALTRLESEAKSLAAANEGCDERVERLEAEALRLAQAAEVADRAAADAVEVAATVLAAHAAALSTRERAKTEAQQASTELERLTKALETARQDDAMRAAETAAAALTAAEDAEAATVAAHIEAEAALAPLKALEAEAREAAEALRAKISGQEAEAKALARLTASVGSGAGTDAILELAKVEPGYEVAFAVALGDDLTASVQADAPIRWTMPTDAQEDPALPGGTPLLQKVDAPTALHRRLRQIAIVDLADGPRLAQHLKPGQRLVTREGALWRWDGFCRDAGAPSAAAERLSQKNRLSALEREIEDLKPHFDAAKANAANALDSLRTAVAAEVDARQATAKARASAGAARQKANAAQAAAQQAQRTEARLAAARETAEERVTQTGQALANIEAESADQSNGEAEVAVRETARRDAVAAREAAAQAGNAMEAERRSTIGRMRRLERIDAEIKDWRGRVSGAEAHRLDLKERLEATAKERDALAEAPSETAAERRRLNAALERADGEVATATEPRVAGEARERDAAKAARDGLETLAQTRESTGRAEERVTAANERLVTVEKDLREILDASPEDAAGLAGLDPAAPTPDRSACETRLERLKAERERLGGVNLCAEDELDEISERQGAMMAERDDLIAAIDKLRTGIKELNKEARSRLVASFDTVNAQFQRLFTHLFGGGEASLQLTEAEDPLEAGLDIIARPPGKKPQVLSLLSGGEQTLTATALIFAVFLTNPAPICVLDEIDAPLDDANVERFCALLDEMTRATQTRFLIITHNPITMARMHRLYGVTMVERGVSQLVSVNLEAAEALRESA
ncbi:MAG: chromosome segregation protein SMC, partial [Pseudomonadota bacterium]